MACSYRAPVRHLTLFLTAATLAGCVAAPEPEVSSDQQGLWDPAARRERSIAIRDVAAGTGMTNGVLLAGIAQVETGLSHCWSEATWACQGPQSPSCGGPVIAGASDGPCSDQQGGLGMFQFDGGTFAQTLARDGEEILLLEGNITHAVDFVSARVVEEIAGVSTNDEAIAWLNQVPVAPGDGVFEEWIALLACRYNGCCGCSSQEAKYRDATVAAAAEFEDGFWNPPPEPPPEPPPDPDQPPPDSDDDPPQFPDDPSADDPGQDALMGGCRAAPGASSGLVLVLAALIALRRRLR